MSLYAIIGRDREASLDARMRVRGEHLARVRELLAEDGSSWPARFPGSTPTRLARPDSAAV